MELYQLRFMLGKLLQLYGAPILTFTFRRSNNDERPHVAKNVIIHDITGDEDKYTLDSHGFQYVKHESKEKDFLDDAKIKAEYYPEIEQLLKDS